MTKTLVYAPGSPKSVKISDTDTSLYLQLAKDNAAVDLSTAKSIIVKIADRNKNYLKDISINPADLLNASKGVLILPLNSTNIAGLPAGQYAFEVWIETADNQQEIYPDVSMKMFSILNNVVGGTTVIAQLTLQQFADKITDMEADLQSKVNSGYFKGDKGDTGDTGATGTVDNAGLTNAPAFQALQQQVNDSAVGENLVEGTYGPFTMGYGIPHTTWQDGWAYSDLTKDLSGFDFSEALPQGGSPWNISKGYYPVKGTTYTQSIYIKTDAKLLKASGGITWSWFSNSTGQNTKPATLVSLGNNIYRMTGSYTWNLDNEGLRVFDIYYPKLSFDFTNATYIAFQHPKLEVGSHATPWCLNPSEILTQSDYAKIQAAIVALGGSL